MHVLCARRIQIPLLTFFLYCPVARAVWFGSSPPTRTSKLNQINIKQWLLKCISHNKNLEQNNMSHLQTIFTTLSTIWLHRNQVVPQSNWDYSYCSGSYLQVPNNLAWSGKKMMFPTFSTGIRSCPNPIEIIPSWLCSLSSNQDTN